MTTSTRYACTPSLRSDGGDPFSSPDPLATSVNDENLYPRSSLVKSHRPSGTKPRTTNVLEDVTLSSHQKTRRKSTQLSKSPSHSQAEHFLSPWKITVTVEAEPEEASSQSIRKGPKTTTAPLHDASPLGSKGRSRNRSSKGLREPANRTEVAEKGVKRGRLNRKGQTSRLTDLDTGFLDEDSRSMDARPRRRSAPREERRSFRALENGIHIDQDAILPTATPEAMAEMTQQLDKDCTHDETSKRQPNADFRSPYGNASPTFPELDFNHVSVRSRNEAPKHSQAVTDGGTFIQNVKPSTTPVTREIFSALEDNKKPRESVGSTVTYPTPDASVQDDIETQGSLTDPTEDHTGFDTILESEGFTMIDLESIPSARHLLTSPDNYARHETETEQSVNSDGAADSQRPLAVAYPVLPPESSRAITTSPSNIWEARKPSLTPIPSYLAPPGDEESELSSTVPSSPPADDSRHVPFAKALPLGRSPLCQVQTPLETEKSSPKLPQPPTQSYKDENLVINMKEAKSTPPRLGRVVRAGIALQGSLSPTAQTHSLLPSCTSKATGLGKANTPTEERLHGLFDGFDSGMRRELRAGLRFGEELAKRQCLSSPDSAPSIRGGGGGGGFLQDRQAFKPASSLMGKEDVGSQTSANHDDLRAREAIPTVVTGLPILQHTSVSQTPTASAYPNKSCDSIIYLDTGAREHRWQLEREAVSRQIQNASDSQVIVLASDDDEDHRSESELLSVHRSPAKSTVSEVDEDIWLAEAEHAQEPTRHTKRELSPRAEQLHQYERGREVVPERRRSPVSGPPKSGDEFDCSSMTNGDMSGMFWQRPKASRKLGSLPSPPSQESSRRVPTPVSDMSKKIRVSSATKDSTPAAEGAMCRDLNYVASSGEEQKPVENNTRSLDDEIHTDGDEQSDSGVATLSQHVEEACDESSLLPLATKIPVNFNDSTDLNSSQLGEREGSTMQSESPPSSPCRPLTPRSAMKGSRVTLGIVDEIHTMTPRKVVFSQRSLCLDGATGVVTSMQVRGGSLSPEYPPCPSEGKHDDEEKATDMVGQERGEEVPAVDAPKQASSTSWFGRLTDWTRKPVPTTSPHNSHQPQCRNSPAAADCSSDAAEQMPPQTEAVIYRTDPKISKKVAASSKSLPSLTDPRIPPPPETLPVSGVFSDYHYKHLHILYLKSLKWSFTRPGSVRPALMKWVGHKFYSGDGEFTWELTERDAEVVERWVRSFEGRTPQEVVRDWRKNESEYREIGWPAKDLCTRLFSIVAGEELRKETKERKEIGTGG